MAFKKVSAVVFVLLVVTATAYARLDVFDDSSTGRLGQTTGSFCSRCECLQGTGGGFICLRSDTKVGSCPFNCDLGSTPWPCSCDETSTCRCTYQVDSCNPTACAAAKITLPEIATVAEEN